MIDKKWALLLKEETKKEYYKQLTAFVYDEYSNGVVYPPYEKVFRALAMPPEKVKVVILGQDPYHNPGEACGLSFSVPAGVKTPHRFKTSIKSCMTSLAVTFQTTAALTHGKPRE